MLNLCLESTTLLGKAKVKYIISSVEKFRITLDDRKEAVVTTPLSEKKSSTNDVDKGNVELEDMKEAVVFPRKFYVSPSHLSF